MHKKAVSAIVALAMTFTLTTSVLADPTEVTNFDQAKQNLNNIKTQIQMLESKLLEAKGKQEQTQKDIADKQAEIEGNKVEVEEAIKKVEESQQLFNDRIRTMYKNGNDSVVNVIFEAKGFADLIDRVESIKTIAKHDKDILNELKAKKDELEAKKEKLDIEKQNLDKLEADLEGQIAGFQSEKTEQEKLVSEATTLVNKYQIDTLAEDRAADEYAKQAMEVVSSRGGGLGNEIVAEALSFRGTPYVWGGTSPQPGFDCSGFVQYVYGYFGISVSRTTYSQVNEGHAVSPSDLQPGDLVFFGPASAPYHVGIYIGGGQYVHAPETGDVVKISNLGSSHGFSSARRIA